MRVINIYINKLNIYLILDFIVGFILFYRLHEIKYIGLSIFILIITLSINSEFMNFINKKKSSTSLSYYKKKISDIIQDRNINQINCNFHLVDNNKLEVWTEPYNNIYISSEILKLDEKMIFGILAHELGHIYSGHIRKISIIINKNIVECAVYIILFNLINIINIGMSPLIKFLYSSFIITIYMIWIYYGINLFYADKLALEIEADNFASDKLKLKEELILALNYYEEYYSNENCYDLEPNLEKTYLVRRINSIKK